MTEPGVSVVICTYRRPDSLAQLLDSLRGQQHALREVIIVDASPIDEARATEARVRSWTGAAPLLYWRVTGARRGLTRQRNFGAGRASGDLVLFLDDDVVLQPECVTEMERAHRAEGAAVAGVGCCGTNQFAPPTRLWRLRRALGIVPSLRPGTYWRSGISVPWTFGAPAGAPVEGDWLPGCAMMWRADVVRAVRFDEAMVGYSQGEDLDFSLRAKRMGRLVMLGTPHLEHRHPLAGRPNAYQLGYMELRNRFAIHRRAVADRRWPDVAWFAYAWTLDTLLLVRHLAIPGRRIDAVRQIAGRLKAAADLCTSPARRWRLRRVRRILQVPYAD